ncbi:unnamed protein product [Heligmosomoides polygyrus]|uniref:E3 ubiquitin-protein ligase n=1 Tax=Heligmosomoides polygyrus TaxID=6339 RepID=A0A3P8BIS7_HELPZ|nr:unnamed protein product [Heligmosomoides polygyrus]
MKSGVTEYEVTNNGLCDNMVPSEEPELSLLDLDKSEGQTVDRNFIRNWKVARDELVRRTLFYSDIIGMSTSVELKTCGHTVHLKCFNAYRETVRNDQRMSESRRSIRDVSCFLCRFSVNALLPLRIDWGFETANRETLVDDRQKTSDDYRPYLEHFTEHIYDLMDARYWNKQDDDSATIFQVQTQLVALMKATVERCILLKKINVPERRKGTRSSVTDEDGMNQTHDRENRWHRCIQGIEDGVHQSILVQIVEEESLTFSDDDLINVTDIRKEDLIALQSVPLLLFDLKSLLVRLSAFVLDNQHFSVDDKKSKAVQSLGSKPAFGRMCENGAAPTDEELPVYAGRYRSWEELGEPLH